MEKNEFAAKQTVQMPLKEEDYAEDMQRSHSAKLKGVQLKLSEKECV